MGKTYEYEEFSSYRRPRRGDDSDSDSDFDSTARNHHNYPPSSRNGGRGHSSRSQSRSAHHRRRDDDSEDDFVREEMHLAPPSHADGPRSRSVPPSSAEGMQLTRAAPPAPSSHHSGGKDKERDQMALAYPYDSDPDERALARDELRRRDRSESPIARARSTVQDNLTNSTAGIGASLLGAVVGGFAAREASAAARRHRDKSARGNRRYSDKEQENDNRIAMLSTLVGAVAGGLGANVLTNKFEDGRAKSKDTQREWERRHGREEDLPHYDDGRKGGDRRETYNDRDYSRDRRSGTYRRYDEEDDEYDFVYDKRGGGPRREVSESGYR